MRLKPQDGMVGGGQCGAVGGGEGVWCIARGVKDGGRKGSGDEWDAARR